MFTYLPLKLLSYILNVCIEKDVYPDKMKFMITIAIYKMVKKNKLIITAQYQLFHNSVIYLIAYNNNI